MPVSLALGYGAIAVEIAQTVETASYKMTMAQALGWLLLLLFCSSAQSFLRRRTRGGTSTKEMHPTDDLFWQKFDHFSKKSSQLWRQRYFVNDAFYKPGGPVFLMIGGSGIASRNCMSRNFTWITYAERLCAFCLVLEHRFYGHSQPTGDLSTASLRYLSSRQALADIANFRTKIAKKMGLTKNKWVAFGCSYGGSLAVWSRIKYPELFDAAVGSSAPILAKVNFYEYFEGVQRALAAHNSECLKTVKEALDQVVEMLKLPKYYPKLKKDLMFLTLRSFFFLHNLPTLLGTVSAAISKAGAGRIIPAEIHAMLMTMGLCQPLKINSVMDATYFLESLIMLIGSFVQHNKNQKNNKRGQVTGLQSHSQYEAEPRGETALQMMADSVFLEEPLKEGCVGEPVLISIDEFCDIMNNTLLGSPYYRYIKIVNLIFKTEHSPCLATSYKDKLEELSDSSIDAHYSAAGRQWFYQSCTEFGFFKTTDSKNQPFIGLPLRYFLKQCSDVFGLKFDYNSLKMGVMATNMYYGGFNVTGSKIIFPNGSVDPWNTLGITVDISKDLPAVFIKGGGHCADMYQQINIGSAELTQAQEKIFHILQNWLKE
ncbi:putative serine protease K12H4.7 [Dugong dugon]